MFYWIDKEGLLCFESDIQYINSQILCLCSSCPVIFIPSAKIISHYGKWNKNESNQYQQYSIQNSGVKPWQRSLFKMLFRDENTVTMIFHMGNVLSNVLQLITMLNHFRWDFPNVAALCVKFILSLQGYSQQSTPKTFQMWLTCCWHCFLWVHLWGYF